jgi:hypothetical protein
METLQGKRGKCRKRTKEADKNHYFHILRNKNRLEHPPHKKPIINDPTKLTLNVPQGNPALKTRWVIPESQYRITAPTAPPIAIYKILNIG